MLPFSLTPKKAPRGMISSESHFHKDIEIKGPFRDEESGRVDKGKRTG